MPSRRASFQDVSSVLNEVISEFCSPLTNFTVDMDLSMKPAPAPATLHTLPTLAITEEELNESGIVDVSPRRTFDSDPMGSPHGAFGSPSLGPSPHASIRSRSPDTMRSRSPDTMRRSLCATPASSPGSERRRLYSCFLCDKHFNNASNLKRHERIHTGDKPYTCEHCNLAFGNSSNRRKHEKTCRQRAVAKVVFGAMP
jgi:hypothetical protein